MNAGETDQDAQKLLTEVRELRDHVRRQEKLIRSLEEKVAQFEREREKQRDRDTEEEDVDDDDDDENGMV